MYTIYKHTNTVTGKAYIGYTSLTMEERWKQHVKLAFQPSKKDSCIKLWRAIRKYGVDSWDHEILTYMDTEQQAHELEISLIESHNTFKKGYNTTRGGEGFKGTHTDDTKKKMSFLKKGKYDGSKNPMYGKKRPDTTIRNLTNNPMKYEETRMKVSNALVGKLVAERNPFWGRHHTNDAKEQLRQAHLGIKQTQETILKKSKKFVAFHVDGRRIEIHGLLKWAREMNLNSSSLWNTLKTKTPIRIGISKGWMVQYAD